MNNLKSIFLTLILIATSFQLFAHALWIETKTNGKAGVSHEVKVFYGEYVSNERDSVAKWYSDVKDFSLWLTAPDNEKIKLTTTPGTNFYSASFTPKSDGVYVLTVVHEAKELGGTTKYEFSSLATVSVGKATNVNTEAISNPLHASVVDAKFYKANSPVKIKAILNGKALANKNVTVFSPEGWSKEYKTDKNGHFEFSALWTGRYVLEVSNFQKTTGEHHGKNYTAVWQGATSSFEVIK